MSALTLHKDQYSGSIQQLTEYDGLISSKTTYDKDYTTAFHYHEHPHLSFILQ